MSSSIYISPLIRSQTFDWLNGSKYSARCRELEDLKFMIKRSNPSFPVKRMQTACSYDSSRSIFKPDSQSRDKRQLHAAETAIGRAVQWGGCVAVSVYVCVWLTATMYHESPETRRSQFRFLVQFPKTSQTAVCEGILPQKETQQQRDHSQKISHQPSHITSP